MPLDYWNHPLIVKALRVKYRGNKLFVLASSYLFLLLVGAMAFHRYRFDMRTGDLWPRYYFVAMISIQFVLSGINALATVSSSMQTEVATRTMDFQRIAALSPLQILLGKVIGEPASGYLLAMVSIPIAVFCHVLGDVTLPVILMLYLTLATTTFMLACVSVQHSLDPAAKAGRAAGGIGAMIFVISQVISVPLGMVGGAGELLAAAVGLLTPVLTIKAVVLNVPFSERMPFFGGHIPYIFLTPIAQAGVAIFALSCMVRRLTHPLATSASKPVGYALLAAVDVLLAGFVFDTIHMGEGLTAAGVRFALGHTILALLLMAQTTPTRESYLSWVWRLRGRRGPMLDLLVGERNLNVVVLAVQCLIGVVVFAVAVALPAQVLRPDRVAQTLWPALWIAGAASVLLIAAYGIFYQALHAAAGKGAGAGFFVVMVLALIVPYAAGEYYEQPLVSSLSPIATFVRLFGQPAEPYNPVPFVVLHLAMTVLWASGLLRVARRAARQVDRKLAAMGVPQAAHA